MSGTSTGGAMLIRRITVSVVAMGITLCTVHSTQAQNFPLRPVRIVTSGVGGGPDAVVRIMAPPMSGSMGQQVFIDNRSSGVIPGQIVSQSPPDGYTLLHYANTLWIGPLLQPAPYDTF